MELVMKYKAKDGTIFDSAGECEEYEANLLNDDYVMFNYRGEETTDPDAAFGIYIGNELSAEALLEKFRIAGIPYPGLEEDSIGAYCWNDLSERYEWVDAKMLPVINSLVNAVYGGRIND